MTKADPGKEEAAINDTMNKKKKKDLM